MITLQSLGYDAYFRRPLPSEYQLTSAVNYDSLFEDGSVIREKLEDGSVDSAKISSIRFDQIEGGTAILGGSNNKSGVLSVRDEANVENVLIDKNGMTVKDENGQTVIDSTGLVSSSTFPNYNQIVPADSIGNVIQIITTETTYTTITNGTNPATYTITVPRQTKIFISGRADLFFYQSGTGGYGAFGRLAIKMGSVVKDEAFFTGDRFAAPAVQTPTGYGFSTNTVSINYMGIIPAGTTNIYLQAYKTSSAGTATELDIVSYSLSYFLLGT